MRKKITILLIMFFYLFTSLTYASDLPNIEASSGILIDINSGRILCSKNINEKRAMASTTKIMTAIIALELGNLGDVVTASQNSARTEGSSIWLEPGEKLTLEELLYGLMLNSGNDAAVAIAEHIGGSVEGFTKLMNDKAKEIGAINTNFTNPHGLHDDKHYTTAYDLALITRYALLNTEFKRIVGTSRKTITWCGKEWDRQLFNRNKLLWQLEGADGVKTGYTKNAGRCLVASATRNGRQFLSVVLSSPSVFEESEKLLEYGFNNYINREIVKRENPIKTIEVKGGKVNHISIYPERDIKIPVKDNEENKTTIIIQTPDIIKAPLKKGQTIGTIKVMLENNVVGISPLIVKEDVEQKSLYKFINNIFLMLFR